MAFPILGTPKPQFFDSSGSPLASGTLSVLNPADDTNKASYPTYDDAEATTNANANPITLDARGECSLWGIDGEDYKLVLKDSSGATIWTVDDVNLATLWASITGADIGTKIWPRSSLEIANSITPTSYAYQWGDVRRYGAVADSTVSTQGTDCATAFQSAVNSGHKVLVPEGWYSVESTIEIFNKSVAGNEGVHVEFSAGARIERYTNVVTPILHVAGVGHKIEGNGAVLAARSFGGFTKGVFLLGPDPALTSNADDSCKDTTNNWIEDFKIIGRTSNTGWDGSVGFYCESAARRRGQYITPTTINCFYNMIRGVYVVQMDYGFFLSTDSNANTFSQCEANDYGHAAVLNNGYGNTFDGFITEKGNVQDTTERAVFHFGEKDFGPEGTHELTDEDATSYSITAITKGATTVLTIGTHTFNTGDLLRITGVVDSGAGDLAALLNGGHFEVTATAATTITISQDTSGASATWSSAGTVFQAPYPIYGAYANRVNGWAEYAFSASTRNIRLCLFEDPLLSFSTLSKTVNHHKNIIQVTGAHPGGIAKDGFSTAASVFANRVDNTTVGFTDYQEQFRVGNFATFSLDDGSGFGYGSKYHQTYTGRMANMTNTTYTVLTVDNVGATSASILIKLSYVYKEAANSDHEAGEISWLCPVYSNTGQTPIKFKDFQANDNGGSQPYLTWSVTASAGTGTNTGKFELKVTHADAPGTDNGFCTWVAEILHDNIQDSNLDWQADVTIQNGGLSDTGGAE